MLKHTHLITEHLLSGNELNSEEISQLIELALAMKQSPEQWQDALNGKHLAMVFDKPSLRTRFSFTVAMQQLGGYVVETLDATRKQETAEDLMRVLQGYCDAVMIRTFSDEFLAKMAGVAKIPIINGLTDLYHPCQILADLMSLQEKFNNLNGLTLSYLSDGNNILHSLLLIAPKMGVNINYCCPAPYGPDAMIVKTALSQAHAGKITAFTDPHAAVANADAVYTDVWESMGYETRDEAAFSNLQVDEHLMKLAKPNAVFMHCMPMNRGKEVSTTLPDHPCSLVFKQSNNRLHIQKALLVNLLP